LVLTDEPEWESKVRLLKIIWAEPFGLLLYLLILLFATSPAWLTAIAIWLRSWPRN